MVRDQWAADYYRAWPPPDKPVGLPAESIQQDTRFPHQGHPHDVRLQEVADPRPIDIGRALREHCRIPAKHYFVAAVLDDGSVAEFLGPSSVDHRVYNKFYNKESFFRCMTRPGTVYEDPDFPAPEPEYRPQFNGRRRHDRNLYGDDVFYSTKSTRKRARFHPKDDDDNPAPVVTAKREILIGNGEEVNEYYGQQFKNLQQTACKLIAKAWVKQVEPKKQSQHPYTGADDKAPNWWPKPWGPTKDEKVRHKEPDHLYKRERVHLLCHILRLVVEPNDKQHPDIQKLDLNVKTLQESANEALTMFFADKEGNNKTKKGYLDYLFQMARQEERFKRGEIDGEQKVYVLKDDKAQSEGYADDGDNEGPKPEDDSRVVSHPKPAPQPQGMVPSMTPVQAHGHGQVQGPVQSPTRSNLPGPPFLGELPVRGHQYTTHAITGSDHGGFMDDNTLGVPTGGQIAIPAASHEPNRRPSAMFQQAPDYQAPPGPGSSGMYPAWPGTSTAPPTSQPAIYNFTHNSATHQPPFAPPAMQSSPPHYMPPTVDGLPRGYDPVHNDVFNTGSFTQPPQQHDYGSYPLDPRGVPGQTVKVDQLGRGPPMN